MKIMTYNMVTAGTSEATALHLFKSCGWRLVLHLDFDMEAGDSYTRYVFTHPIGIFTEGIGEDAITALVNAWQDGCTKYNHLRNLIGDTKLGEPHAV